MFEKNITSLINYNFFILALGEAIYFYLIARTCKKQKCSYFHRLQKTHTSHFAPPVISIFLHMQDLSVGMLFLGCIKEVKDFELVISLPYNLVGFVQATNICEAYTKLLNEQVEKEEPVEVSVVILCRLGSLISFDSILKSKAILTMLCSLYAACNSA